jgi:hypothetical protein
LPSRKLVLERAGRRGNLPSAGHRVIKKEDGERIIFTAGSVKDGDQGSRISRKAKGVHYRVFNDRIVSIDIAGDVWKKNDGGK